MTLGSRIKALRQQKGWGILELSRRANVRQATISEIESGKRRDMTTQTAKRIALALGVGVDFLIGTWDMPDDPQEADTGTPAWEHPSSRQRLSGRRGPKPQIP